MSLEMHEIAEADHRILNPFTDAQLMTLAESAHLQPGTRVLDLACGKGELLCRWAEEFGVTGHGVDISEVFLAAARGRAEELGVADRVSFEQGDAGEHAAQPSSYDVVSCLGATWIGGGLTGTLDLMRPAVRADGLLLVGEPYWIEPAPSAAALDALGIEPEEYASLPGTAERLAAAGCELVEMELADPRSWDRYVAAQWWTCTEWLRVHPVDALAPDVRRFRDRSRDLYLEYGRRYLGWGVFVLRPTG